MKIRNVAIIAHVDHGKTTLVDAFLRQSGVFRANQKIDDRILDSNALEKERGITILAKNVSVQFGDVKINIVDTPGHADFGGEVERILSMVDGALLVVDAVEGPMPQTRFVLHKALMRGLSPIVVVNKCDRPAAEPNRVVDEVFDLFVALDASEEQLDFPVFYASALTGRASADLEELLSEAEGARSILPLLQGVVDYVPEPTVQTEGLQMMISNLEYNDYVGRIALGRIQSGVLLSGQEILLTHSGQVRRAKVSQVYTYQGLEMVSVDKMAAGILQRSAEWRISRVETVNRVDHPKPLPAISVDQPTLTMVFRVNDGPLAGQDAQYLTSRQLRDRLIREARVNVAQVEDTDSPDQFRVSGGELHLSVLIETMRQGLQFCVTKPEPVLQHTDEGFLNPMSVCILTFRKTTLAL